MKPSFSLNYLLTKKAPNAGGLDTRVYEFSRPVLLQPFTPRVELRTGELESGQVIGTMRLLQELRERRANSAGLRTGEGDLTAGLREAAETMGLDTTGIEYDSGALKRKLAHHRAETKTKKAEHLLADAARLAGKGGSSVRGMDTDVLQAAVHERRVEKAAVEEFDKERFSVWRPLQLVRPQSIAALATVAINQTPPRNMWAQYLQVTGADFFSFTTLFIMGETMFSGDSALGTGDYSAPATQNQPLDMELQSGVPVTGGFFNADPALPHVGSAKISGYIEKLVSTRK